MHIAVSVPLADSAYGSMKTKIKTIAIFLCFQSLIGSSSALGGKISSNERTPPTREKTLELEIRTSEIRHLEKKTSRKEIERDVDNLNNRRRHLSETQQRSHERGTRTSPPSPVALVVGVHFVDADERDPSKNPFIKDHSKAEAVTILKSVLYPNGAEYEIEIYFRNKGTKDEPMAYAEAVSEEIRHAGQVSKHPEERLRRAVEESERLEAVLKRENDKFLKRFLSKKEINTLYHNNAPLLASIDVENFQNVITILGYNLEKEEISEIMRRHLDDLLLIQSKRLSKASIILGNHLEEEDVEMREEDVERILKKYWKEITTEEGLRSLQEMNLSSGESAYDQIEHMLSKLKKGEDHRSIPGFGTGDSAFRAWQRGEDRAGQDGRIYHPQLGVWDSGEKRDSDNASPFAAEKAFGIKDSVFQNWEEPKEMANREIDLIHFYVLFSALQSLKNADPQKVDAVLRFELEWEFEKLVNAMKKTYLAKIIREVLDELVSQKRAADEMNSGTLSLPPEVWEIWKELIENGKTKLSPTTEIVEVLRRKGWLNVSEFYSEMASEPERDILPLCQKYQIRFSDIAELFAFVDNFAFGGVRWANITRIAGELASETDPLKTALIIDKIHAIFHNTGPLIEDFIETKWNDGGFRIFEIAATVDGLSFLVHQSDSRIRKLVFKIKRGGSLPLLKYESELPCVGCQIVDHALVKFKGLDEIYRHKPEDVIESMVNPRGYVERIFSLPELNSEEILTYLRGKLHQPEHQRFRESVIHTLLLSGKYDAKKINTLIEALSENPDIQERLEEIKNDRGVDIPNSSLSLNIARLNSTIEAISKLLDGTITKSKDRRRLRRRRNDRGSVMLPYSPSFAGSLGKFTAALALKEAMKEFLTGREGEYAHLLSSEQVVGYGAFGLVSGTGEEASRALGDAIARKTGLNAFSSRTSMISPYRLGSHALFMTLGMQADQIARLWMGGIKDQKDIVTALNDAFGAWWSQFQSDEAALTTAGFLLTKPLVSKSMQAVRSGVVQRLRNLQKNIRWGHRLLSGTNRFSPWGILEEAIVLLTVDLLMEEYVEWKKESELKEKIEGIFNELSDLVDVIDKENANESAQKMGALFEDLRAVRMAYVHLEKEDVSKKYQAFQEALKDLLDHKSGMFWRDAKAIYAAREVRDSEENKACQSLFEEMQKENPLKFSPESSGQFYRNHLCQHLTFLKMWSDKLEEVKKRYYEYQMAYANSENKKYDKYVFTSEFLKKIDLKNVGKPEVFDIRYANQRDIYQLEQAYYETALQKVSDFISPDMAAVFNALKEVARGAKAAEVVFETSFEQLEENKIEGDFEIDNMLLLTEILKEDKFWIELVVESRNPTGIYTTYNPGRLHVMNEMNCLLAGALHISDDVFSLEGTEEKPWMSCGEYGERFSTQDEEEKRRWLGVFIHGFLNSGIQD